jgi:hypothetical protein
LGDLDEIVSWWGDWPAITTSPPAGRCPAAGTPVLLPREPSWSFLYRRMPPGLAAAGLRAIAPDLVGYDRSDKPAAVAEHSYARHAWGSPRQ